MTDNRTTELLRKLLDERGVEHEDYAYVIQDTQERCEITRVRDYAGRVKARFMSCNEPGKVDVAVKLTPEQAIAATLGSDNEYEAKMDALLCRLTNGKWSKTRAYDLDFMVSCVDEEYETLYAKELAELGSGTCELHDCDGSFSAVNRPVWRCDCGAFMTQYTDATTYHKPRFCPNCGRRVER